MGGQTIKLISQWKFRESNSSADGSSENQTHQPMGVLRIKLIRQYTVKKVIDFPSSAGMSLFSARESLAIGIPAGEGKIDYLILQCRSSDNKAHQSMEVQTIKPI
jgi:hypothetical protein